MGCAERAVLCAGIERACVLLKIASHATINRPAHLQPYSLFAADTLQKVFFDWRFLKAANRLRWLLLADNPLLGRAPAPAAPGPSQAGDTQAAAGGFLPPAQLLPLQWRVFAAAPLRLLDIRNTGRAGGWAAGLASLLPCGGGGRLLLRLALDALQLLPAPTALACRSQCAWKQAA